MGLNSIVSLPRRLDSAWLGKQDIATEAMADRLDCDILSFFCIIDDRKDVVQSASDGKERTEGFPFDKLENQATCLILMEKV